MLKLTRRVGEVVYIGDDIKVRVDEIRGQSVRLAFDAPDDVIIDREELRLKKIAEQEAPGR